MTRADAIAMALRPVEGGRIVWIDLEPVGPGARARAGALPVGKHDAVVVAAGAGDLDRLLGEACSRLRPGGVIVVVLAVQRQGWRRAAQRVLRVFDVRRRPRALEDVCGALLRAGATSIAVLDVDGLRGEAVVHGVVPDPCGEEPSSA